MGTDACWWARCAVGLRGPWFYITCEQMPLFFDVPEVWEVRLASPAEVVEPLALAREDAKLVCCD